MYSRFRLLSDAQFLTSLDRNRLDLRIQLCFLRKAALDCTAAPKVIDLPVDVLGAHMRPIVIVLDLPVAHALLAKIVVDHLVVRATLGILGAHVLPVEIVIDVPVDANRMYCTDRCIRDAKLIS